MMKLTAILYATKKAIDSYYRSKGGPIISGPVYSREGSELYCHIEWPSCDVVYKTIDTSHQAKYKDKTKAQLIALQEKLEDKVSKLEDQVDTLHGEIDCISDMLEAMQ